MNNKRTTTPTQLARPLSIFGSTALISSANAALVQIDFSGNTITAGGGNQLFADMDFDGNDDLAFTNINYISSGGLYYAAVRINGGGLNFASYSTVLPFTYRVINGAAGIGSSRGFIAASFNNSALGTHQGFLEVTNSIPGSSTGVSIIRFIYDDASATLSSSSININTQYTSIGTTTATSTTIVPEPSSLGLLALGAGGLALRRRRRAA